MPQHCGNPPKNRDVVRQGERTRRAQPAAKPAARTNSPSSIVYNCSSAARKGPAAHAVPRDEGAADAACAYWAVAKILSSGSDAETEPKMPPWALIMARPIS